MRPLGCPGSLHFRWTEYAPVKVAWWTVTINQYKIILYVLVMQMWVKTQSLLKYIIGTERHENICDNKPNQTLDRHLTEHGHFKGGNKGKLDETIQSLEPATSQQPRYERRMNAVTKKILEKSEKEKRVHVLLPGEVINILCRHRKFVLLYKSVALAFVW